MLQNHPVLRERVLGVTAISALILGGIVAMDTLITGGWQWSAASAGQPTIQQDDVNQQWNDAAPGAPRSSPVGFAANTGAAAAAARPGAQGGAASGARGLAGAANLALTAYRPGAGQAPRMQGAASVQLQTAQPQSVLTQSLASAQTALPAAPIDEAAATARFNQIEAQMQQAEPQRAPPAPKRSDGGDGVDMTGDPN
jgi:hypothetical protein